MKGGGVAWSGFTPAPKSQATQALGVSRSIMDNEMSIISNHSEIKNKQRANTAGFFGSVIIGLNTELSRDDNILIFLDFSFRYDSVHQKYKLLDIF